MKPDSCPRFHKCNAPICPLDLQWERRTILHNDPTCYYLTESIKNQAETNFESAGLQHLFASIVRVRPQIEAKHPRIKKALERAKLSGSRMTRVPAWGKGQGKNHEG